MFIRSKPHCLVQPTLRIAREGDEVSCIVNKYATIVRLSWVELCTRILKVLDDRIIDRKAARRNENMRRLLDETIDGRESSPGRATDMNESFDIALRMSRCQRRSLRRLDPCQVRKVRRLGRSERRLLQDRAFRTRVCL